MAADKKTLLREALKQVQAGKVEKAVETYRAIVKLDPKDAAARNSLADMLGRQGKKRDAIAEYLEASALYEKDGFGPRAIAICQKIVKLDPEQWGVRLKLGDLYAGQKLVAEARAIYLQLAERHDRRGDVAAELEIFRRLADLDPANLPMRVKLAGMFEKQKQPDQAAAEYVRAAKGHVARKEADAAAQLLVRAFKLSPANMEARRLLADFYVQRQEWQVVVGLLETPVAKGGQESDVIVLYADALTRVDHADEAVALLEKLQAGEPNAVPVNLALGRAYLKAGDVEKGTAALSRCVGAHLAENRLESAESLLQEMAAAAPDDDKILQRLVEVAHKRGDDEAAAGAYLRLAAIYERKGLVRNAVGALERYLEGRPGDAAATSRLARLRAEAAAPTSVQPPGAAPAPASSVALPPLPAPTAEAAAMPETVPPPAPAAAKVPDAAPEEAKTAPPTSARPRTEEEFEIDIEDEGDLSQFVVEDEEDLIVIDEEDVPAAGEEEIPETAAEPAGAPQPAIAAAPVEAEPEELIEIALDEEEGEEPLPPPDAVAAAYGEISLEEPAPGPDSRGEPEGEYGVISLAAGPAEGEIAPIPPEEPVLESAGGGAAPVGAVEEPPQATPESLPWLETESPPGAVPATASETAPATVAETLAELPPETGPEASATAGPEAPPQGEPEVDTATAAATVPETPPAAAVTDLFEDLRLELESEGDLVPPPLEEAGLREILQEFQRSMREQLSDEDFDTHYNLGIAYKEMGLTEEAIGEFSLAEKSPARRLEAVSMIAICLREQGRLEEAAQKLRTGVALALEGSAQQKGFLYDLAMLHEQTGRLDLAQEALQRLYAMDAAYRDVAARVGAAPPGDAPPRKSKISYL